MEIDYRELGEKIEKLRNSQPKKLSREKLGEHVGVSGTAIYRWERNIDKPDLAHALKLCKYFKLSLYQLINRPMRSDLIARLVSSLGALDERQLAGLLDQVERFLSDSANSIQKGKSLPE